MKKDFPFSGILDIIGLGEKIEHTGTGGAAQRKEL